jgi:hypothetical protein
MGVDVFQQARIGPTAKVAVGALLGRQIFGQIAPLATGAQKIEDGIEQFAVAVLAPAASGGGLGKTI